MNDPRYRIPSDQPAAPIADWLIKLLAAYPDLAKLPFTSTHSWADLLWRLRRIRPTPAAIDFAAMTRVHPPRRLRDTVALITTLCQISEITKLDPDFPWTSSPLDNPSTMAEPNDLPWETREALRLVDGTYTHVPWGETLEPIPSHFVHVSINHDGLVAYTETATKGALDIQTPIKPARYLKRFYPDLADHVARDLAAAVRPVDPLKLAVTADEIEHVYVTGPSSCMSKEEGEYESHCHPVRVYGNSDLQLAYITNDDGPPIARALVWPERKLHARIYGWENRMTLALAQAGYTRGSLTGARIRRIEEGDGSLVMPYIDDDRSFDVIDEHWLAIGGPHAASMTEGCASLVPLADCERCDDRTPIDDMTNVAGEHWCPHCTDHYSFRSEYSDARFADDEECEVVVQRHKGRNVYESWANSERDDHAFHCDATEDWYAHRTFDAVEREDGRTWVDWYAERYAEDEPSAAAEARPIDTPVDQAAA